MENTLYYGDNLPILREHIPGNSIDLIYLDPPFSSNKTYNILFKEPTGQQSEAQITAFEDTWHWTEEAERTFDDIIHTAPPNIVEMMKAFRNFVGRNDVMAYLTMMCIRLIELRRVLKDSGSIYLHCDPTASHYLKILMDTIFGKTNFINEIIWRRQNAKGLAFTRFPSNHDVILFYSRTESREWHPQYKPHDPTYLKKFYRFVEPETGRKFHLADLTNPNRNRPHLTYEFLGVTRVWRWTQKRMQSAYEQGLIIQSKPGAVPRLKRYLDEQEGTPIDDIWTDIPAISAQAAERLGYPTQKPKALLARIIKASSPEGGLVLDPFCGCGTATIAAHKLGRHWIGIDITHLAINVIKLRLKNTFGLLPKKDYLVLGEPEDLAGAKELATQSRYQFQWWASSLIGAHPYADKKKGADTGIDAIFYFSDMKGQSKKVIVQVKSGKVGVKDIRDLGHVIDREKAEIGIFITLEPPTKDMSTEATSKGFYISPIDRRKHLRIQIKTIEELLENSYLSIDIYRPTMFKKAEGISKEQFKLNV